MMKFKMLFVLMLAMPTLAFSQQAVDTVKKATKPAEDPNKDDWADLRHYAAANQTLGAPKQGEKRVVFLGSSIFEFWKTREPSYFAAHPEYIDRGISGQISAQLLLRFRQDVIDLQPKAVIILAGSNDIAANIGHLSNEVIMNNIQSMAELAKLYQIKVILCAYLPVFDYPWRKGIEPAGKIMALNELIKAYAAKNKFTLLDYFTPLADERNGQKAELTIDGVHPNPAGYKIMEPITDEAIRKAVGR